VGLESSSRGSESRFAAYVEAVTAALGHADRAAPFQSYCADLLLPGDRKSVEPMAARVQPGRVQAAHQSLHHLVAKSDRSDDAVLASRFAAVRVHPTHRDYHRQSPRPEEWCLIEWPDDEPEPTKYFLSTLPATISRRALVNTAKLRWRIERDYQDLKHELGLGHYEGRGWRGFHHHATLCIAAYGFLLSERGAIPPSGPRRAVLIEEHPLPAGYRPRGSPDQT
jgi:SRSO17 transposase